jgi:hypothetical protein
MTKFADQLFDDLMREHGPALARSRPPAPAARRITPRRMLLAAGGGGLAAAGVIAGVLASGGGAPAYAVTKNANGTITLAVDQKSGIAGANARLRQLGEQQVVVVPTGPGCPSLDSLSKPVARPGAPVLRLQTSTSRDGSVTVHAQGIPAGNILVVATETTAQGTVTGQAVISPPAPSCVSLPAPPSAGAGQGGSGS